VTSIRSTATDWLDYLSPRTEVEGRLLQYLDAFRMQLCAALDLDLDFDDTEVLYARYPVGGFYRAHCDSHSPGPGVKARDTERRLSFVLFINAEAWHTTDGGSLRILGTEAAPWISPVDIDPVPG
jgi:Rps23 Pro-64 3,4-dihydroxylase Tpa1-like proline 4-hydroxylase